MTMNNSDSLLVLW